MASVLHPDPFAPVLLSSQALVLSGEQQNLIKEVLDIACSDSQFADKAYRAIQRVLTAGSVVVPVVTSLTPNSAEIGDPNFTIHVHGTGFKSNTQIIFAGQLEPTTYVSATEVTTGVNMSVWLGPDVLPVAVITDDVESNAMNFTFTDGSAPLAFSSVPSSSPALKSADKSAEKIPVHVNPFGSAKKEEKK